MNDKSNIEETSLPINQVIAGRIQKLDQIRDRGFNPFQY
jgi:hypothetical protein